MQFIWLAHPIISHIGGKSLHSKETKHQSENCWMNPSFFTQLRLDMKDNAVLPVLMKKKYGRVKRLTAPRGALLYPTYNTRTVYNVKNDQTWEVITFQTSFPTKLCVTSSNDFLVPCSNMVSCSGTFQLKWSVAQDPQ